VFSAVRTRHIGFLNDYRRINVALTRAKFGMIIIGNARCLRNDIKWNRLISRLISDNRYFENIQEALNFIQENDNS
jgi:superfamily I DNA and/or RNA helicase